MEAKILNASLDENIIICADVIMSGGLVGVPTETVYGLGANALSGDAVAKIFATKGRHTDNPLIVHVASPADVQIVVREIPDMFRILSNAFWPGPLTLIMKKSDVVPDEVTAGLDTVAVRMPEHPAMLSLIKKSGVPIAAPSANLSGKPSPTKAKHVFDDLFGKIPYVLDGGNCRVGVESTVVDISGDTAQILRPGGVTYEELEKVLGVAPTIYNTALADSDAPRSPGMKYRHYSPKAPLTAILGSPKMSSDFILTHIDDCCNGFKCCGGVHKVAALMFDDFASANPAVVTFGESSDHNDQASRLFDALRQLDSLDADIILAQVPDEKGLGHAVANRILKAAASVQHV